MNPPYLYEGQIVYVSARHVHPKCKLGMGLKCKVDVAYGDSGVVVNKNYRFRRLLSRWDMFIETKENKREPEST